MQNQLETSEKFPLTLPGSPLGIVWSFTYGYQQTPAAVFLPQLRQIGAAGTRVFLSWNQLEPEPGHFDWQALDTLLDQLSAPEDALLMLNSASTWATRFPTDLLPPSPARDLETYYRFVHTVVSHCRGRVRYWQNDNEPSNPMFWQGSVEEFIAQLRVFYQAVKDADPEASVVLGGFDGLFNPYDIEHNPWGQEGLIFFDRVLSDAHAFFDVFDIHLYANAYLIPAQIGFVRQKMRSLGFEKPIIVAEYHGPGFGDFPENMHYLRLMGQWMSAVTAAPEEMENIQQQIRVEMANLYASRETLPPQTQLFMEGSSRELDEKWYRINSRELVMRTLLALSAGVQKLYYWNAWSDTSDKLEFMNLMFGRQKLMDYEDGELKHFFPSAYAYQRMAQALYGVEQVQRLNLPAQPSVYLFEVQRRERGPVFVVWQQRDTFSGEDEAPTPFACSWQGVGAQALDALGQIIPVEVRDGQLHLPLSLTPIFIEPTTKP